ncbi:hypothetical protein Aperf_G00000050331 [Anoplocephala perfoliata]
MSSFERHLDGDLETMELCRGIGSRPDSGFSDVVVRSSTMEEVSDNSFQDSLLQSSPFSVRSPPGRSSNQDTSRLWRPLHRPVVIRPVNSRSIMSVNAVRSFRPRSAPLAFSEFSLLEEDQEGDADDEISDHDQVPNKQQFQQQQQQIQLASSQRDHSPPPPAVFIPRDRRRSVGCRVEMCRCHGGRLSTRRQLTDTRSVATQTFIPSMLTACPRPTPHRRLFAVRPQSAPLQEEEEDEETDNEEEGQIASSWGDRQEPQSPTLAVSAVLGGVKSATPCCHFCFTRFEYPLSPPESSRSSSVFPFGDDMLELLEECGAATSPCCRVQRQEEFQVEISAIAETTPDHEMLHEVTPFLDAPQRPTYVRLRSASAPIEAKDCEGAPRQLLRHIRRRPRRHSSNYGNLVCIAKRMADIGDAFEMEQRLSHNPAILLSQRASSLQWLSSSLVDLVARPIEALRDLWTSGSIDTREEERHAS